MIDHLYLRVNEPNVIHDTIDGETILLNLNTGTYFSIDGLGVLIWDAIHQTGDRDLIIRLLADTNPEIREEIERSVLDFTASLIHEGLVVPIIHRQMNDLSEELKNNLVSAAKNYIVPVLNKYSDMQDLLLLDPIHEVDERGWPENREVQGSKE